MTMPVPMPVETLTRHSDVAPGKPGGVLAERGGVGVVGGQHRHAGQPGLQVLGDRVAVPARQDRRLAGPTGHRVDGPGEADRRHRTGRRRLTPARGEQRRPSRRRSGRAPADGPSSTATSISASASTGPARSVSAIRACVVSTRGDEHRGVRDVEGQAAAPAATGRGRAAVALDDHARRRAARRRRWATVIRDSPVGSRTSPRVLARPAGSGSSTSPGPVGIEISCTLAVSAASAVLDD